jgi:uncharacterized membrane protein
MDLKRFWRHVLMSPVQAARSFPAATLDAIEREIAAHERLHRGEVCFVVEAELTTAQLWAGLPSRERAKEVFAQRGVWNTEENNGVLVYVLLADARVEIVADRGIDRTWRRRMGAICDGMDAAFRAGRYEEGARGRARGLGLLARHFPGTGDGETSCGTGPY